MKRLMIMAAGTGGHIFPGIAIAQAMKSRGWDVTWLGTAHGMEQDLVPRAGIELEAIEFSGMRGKGLLGEAPVGYVVIDASKTNEALVPIDNPFGSSRSSVPCGCLRD